MWILGISSLCVSQVSEIRELEQNDFSILNNEFHLNLVWSHSFILIFLQCIDLSTQRRPRPGLARVAQHFWARSVLGCSLILTRSQPADLARERQGTCPFFAGGGEGSGYGLMCMPVYFLEEIPGKRMAKSKLYPLTNFLVDIARLSFRRGSTNPLSKCGLIFRIHLRDLICFFQG